MAKDYTIPDYTEFLNDVLEGADSVLKDFPFEDSIALDQSQAPTSSQNTAFTADGSDANIFAYDFSQPTGIRMFYQAASNHLPLINILPVGIANSGLAGAIFQHGTETIQVEVAGQGEGLGERWALFTSDFATHAAYFGLFDNDDGTYEVRSNVPILSNDYIGLQGVDLRSGSGDPNGSVTAPQGSLYLRTDGSSTSTRAYINTDGATAWTNVVTAT